MRECTECQLLRSALHFTPFGLAGLVQSMCLFSFTGEAWEKCLGSPLVHGNKFTSFCSISPCCCNHLESHWLAIFICFLWLLPEFVHLLRSTQ